MMRQLGIGLVLFQSVLLQAQAQPVAPSPGPNVKLDVRTRDNQRTFRIGEIIPLELRFSSEVDNRYLLQTRNGDRSGRLTIDTYSVEPLSGWQDPLYLYFRTGVFVGGGLGSERMLSREPVLITADLNEWVRFDKAGEFRLTVRSRRVRQGAVVSNQVPLTIVDATPEWQAETLSKALGTIRSGGRDGIRTLRFLGTPAAARELAHCVTDIECVLGLAGSPARKAALDEMNKLLHDSTVVVDGWIPHLMSVLQTPQNEDDKH